MSTEKLKNLHDHLTASRRRLVARMCESSNPLSHTDELASIHIAILAVESVAEEAKSDPDYWDRPELKQSGPQIFVL